MLTNQTRDWIQDVMSITCRTNTNTHKTNVLKTHTDLHLMCPANIGAKISLKKFIYMCVNVLIRNFNSNLFWNVVQILLFQGKLPGFSALPTHQHQTELTERSLEAFRTSDPEPTITGPDQHPVHMFPGHTHLSTHHIWQL